MSTSNTDKEIQTAFVKNALQKLQEMNGIANVLLREGAKPELTDAFSRASNALKNFAVTCHQNQVADFVAGKVDPHFEAIRLENVKITDELKQNIKDKMSQLKELIQNIAKDEVIIQQDTENIPKEEEQNLYSLLSAIGQLSVWSFHELMNTLAKVQGFTEMLDDIYSQIPEAAKESRENLKTIQNKLIANTSHMTGVINRIRSLRGKTKIVIKEYNIRDVVKNIQDLTQQPPKTLNWSSLHIPSVMVPFDQIIFEQIWVHLWKLLGEWLPPKANAQPKCFGKIELNKNTGDIKYKNKISLFFWYEPYKSEAFDPTSLTYTPQTPQADLAYVYHFTSQIAGRINSNIGASKAPFGGTVFSITLPCADVVTSVNETGYQVPQPLHIGKLSEPEKNSKTVLIIDDEKDLRTILSLKVNKMGYNVFVAENITEAINFLDNKKIDLIISDLFIGQESGLDLLKTLTVSDSKIPFIFITRASEDDISKPILDILAKYSKAFLTKPIPTQLLKETLDKFIPK